MRRLSSGWSGLLFSLLVAAGASGGCGQSAGETGKNRDAAASGGTAAGGSSGGGGAAATGGSAASGGASGSGGAGGAAGASGSGGTTVAGGTTAAGGSVRGGSTSTTGGRTSSGGTTSAGGRTGAGGTTGAGGMTGSGGNGDAATTALKDGGPFADGPSADVGVVPKDAADAASSTCSGSLSAPKAGDSTVTLQSGGRSRSYILHAPSGVTAGTALPLIIDLHGAGGNGKQQQGMSGFSSLADKEKFLAVFPDGVDGYWNVDDKCCGTAGKEKIDDVGFLKAIITKLSAEACIDARRIYVSGFSNGGGLAHRMGCDAADLIAAIAPTATDLRTQPCNAARPISMMEIKGMADSLEPYEGGLVGPAGGQYTAVGAKASQKLWADIDKCTGTTTTSDKYCENYTQCADGVEVDLCSLPNTDHSPYSNSLGFNVASVAWGMFKRQPMK